MVIFFKYVRACLSDDGNSGTPFFAKQIYKVDVFTVYMHDQFVCQKTILFSSVLQQVVNVFLVLFIVSMRKKNSYVLSFKTLFILFVPSYFPAQK